MSTFFSGLTGQTSKPIITLVSSIRERVLGLGNSVMWKDETRTK